MVTVVLWQLQCAYDVYIPLLSVYKFVYTYCVLQRPQRTQWRAAMEENHSPNPVIAVKMYLHLYKYVTRLIKKPMPVYF